MSEFLTKEIDSNLGKLRTNPAPEKETSECICSLRISEHSVKILHPFLMLHSVNDNSSKFEKNRRLYVLTRLSCKQKQNKMEISQKCVGVLFFQEKSFGFTVTSNPNNPRVFNEKHCRKIYPNARYGF